MAGKLKKIVCVIFFLLGLIPGQIKLYCQSFTEPSKMKQFNITVNFDDYTVKTQMLSQNKNIRPDNERVYMWYTSQKIMETKGGFDGKLIHGSYRSFYLNNQLKEKGEVKYGLKHKEWKYWYSDGTLKEVIHWKNKIKNGTYYLYNDYGQLMAKSTFKKNKLNGRFYTYGTNGKIIEKKKYKNGDEIISKPRQKIDKKPVAPLEEKEKKMDTENKKQPSFFDRIFEKKEKKVKKIGTMCYQF